MLGLAPSGSKPQDGVVCRAGAPGNCLALGVHCAVQNSDPAPPHQGSALEWWFCASPCPVARVSLERGCVCAPVRQSEAAGAVCVSVWAAVCCGFVGCVFFFPQMRPEMGNKAVRSKYQTNSEPN